jgi:hypothetical protein
MCRFWTAIRSPDLRISQIVRRCLRASAELDKPGMRGEYEIPVVRDLQLRVLGEPPDPTRTRTGAGALTRIMGGYQIGYG